MFQSRKRPRSQGTQRKRAKRRLPYSNQRRRYVNPSRLSITRLPRYPVGIPDKLRTKLRLQANITTTLTAGAYNGFICRLNDVIDPIVGTSVQPYMLDQMSALYQRFRVVGATFELYNSFNSLSVTSTSAFRSILVPASRSSAFSNAQQAVTQPRAYEKLYQVNAYNANTSLMRMYQRADVVLGLKKSQYEDDPLTAGVCTIGAETAPTTRAHMHVYFVGMSGNDVTINSDLKITFYVEFFDRQVPANS